MLQEKKNNSAVYNKMVFIKTKLAFTEVETTCSSIKEEKKIDYVFKFWKNNKSCEFYTNDQKIFETWKNFLRYKCVLSTFHDDFEVKKMIGKGSFAKVKTIDFLIYSKENILRYT